MKRKILVWSKYPSDAAFYICDALKKDHHLMVRCDMLGNIHTHYVHVICTNEPSRVKASAPFDAIFDRVLDGCAELSQYSLFISAVSDAKTIANYISNEDRKEAVRRLALNSVYGATISDGFRAGSAVIDQQIAAYCANNVKNTMEMVNKMFFNTNPIPKIKNVIFNDPATIVFWSDGSKTVVKCQDDDWYDPEKGLAMAISKKALGNKGNYCNEIKKWLPEEEPIDWYEITKAAHAITDGLVMGISAPIIPELANKCGELANKMRAKKKESAVQKVYDALVNYRDGGIGVDVDELIGYLGEALEE